MRLWLEGIGWVFCVFWVVTEISQGYGGSELTTGVFCLGMIVWVSLLGRCGYWCFT